MLHLAHKIAGATVSGTDGEIGTLEDFYFDEPGWTVRYLLVDTGTWFKGKRVLVSPRWVQSDWGRGGVHVNLSRDEVWNSADGDERHVRPTNTSTASRKPPVTTSMLATARSGTSMTSSLATTTGASSICSWTRATGLADVR